jgi:DNA-binding response OmpR family regulator
MQSEGNSIKTERLLEEVWNDTGTNDGSVVKSTIYRLRSKLAGSGCNIVYGRLDKGYRFEAE